MKSFKNEFRIHGFTEIIGEEKIEIFCFSK